MDAYKTTLDKITPTLQTTTMTDQAQKNKEDIIEIRGELRLINQKLDTLVNNHIWHINRDISALTKIVVTVSTVLFSGVITLLIKAFFI